MVPRLPSCQGVLARFSESFCPMLLDAATVRRIAKLARIGIADAEIATLMGDLNGIIGWIEQLSEVDIEGVAPLVGVEQAALRLRSDTVTDVGLREAVLSGAPDRAGSFYAVPKVVE